MNLKEVEKACRTNRAKLKKTLTQINRNLNQAIKEGDEEVIYLNLRFYIILLVAWLESTLLFLIFHHNKQISVKLREEVLSQRTQVDKWRLLIESIYRIYYLNGKTSRNLNLVNLGHTPFNRLQYLLNLLENEVKVFIEIRNKLAHGQWSVVLNNDLSNKNQDLTTKVWTLTKKETWYAKNIITNFSKFTDTLVKSQAGFEKEFDSIVNKIETVRELHGPNFQKIIDKMHEKWSRVEVTITRKHT